MGFAKPNIEPDKNYSDPSAPLGICFNGSISNRISPLDA